MKTTLYVTIANEIYSKLEVRMYNSVNDSLKSKCYNRIYVKMTFGLYRQLHSIIHSHTKSNIKLKKHR